MSDKIEAFWDMEAENEGTYTVPRLNLTRECVEKYSQGLIEESPDIPVFPRSMLVDVKDKKVLCLASGGGQQSPVFGLLGAHVTVLDISAGQLHGDKVAAEHYGYEAKLVKGDMRDLSSFADGEFDIVYQPISICFVPDVSEVYREVYRVLRPSGSYAVAHVNPSTYPTSFVGGQNGWDGIGYRIAEIYKSGPILMSPDGRENMLVGEPTGEYRHVLHSIFGKLLELGFIIREVIEDPRHLRGKVTGEPGGYEHHLSYVAEYFKIVCIKPVSIDLKRGMQGIGIGSSGQEDME
ncbi:MAG: class I SAM-dependent methyltransferase [Armatimonadetes bacterium]|nr:class I SAM-dependent methyltransferase [Armatimonadota bacterium]